MRQTRRSFLKASGVAAAAVLARPRMAAADAGAKQGAVEPKLRQFGYGDVELLEGPMRQQFDANHAFYLRMDEDMLLKPFRQRAGQAAPGEDMGGWYDDSADFNPHGSFHGFVPGHSFGQYVSGLARAYAATGSKPTQAKVERLVSGFAATVSTKFYEGYHLPAYTFDKTCCGLIDAHEFAGDGKALMVLNAATDAVLPYLPEKALARSEQYARPHKDDAYCWDETYTLPENFFLAWRRGAGSRYRELAARFLEDDLYFDPLAEGRNVLPGEHAYSHVNALSSAMQAYLVLGSEKHLRAARNGFDLVRSGQSFATGGWGPDESFRKPGSGEMGESLKKSHAGFETPCGAYGHFKITRYLMGVTGDSRYGDSMERVLYNTILGAKPLKEDGSSFYYSDYNSVSAKKGYHRDKWPCCSGTFPQITADYGISSYFHDAAGIYVNLFVPSRVKWRRDGARVELTQKTSYPYRAATQIEIATDKPRAFAVFVRIPAWAGAGTTIAVNGKRVLEGPKPGSPRTGLGSWGVKPGSPRTGLGSWGVKPGEFARVDREWKNGDRVEVEFAIENALEAVDEQHPETMALMHGPLALFGVGAVPETVERQELLGAAQIAGGSTDWQTKNGRFRLRPFAEIRDEEYRLYMTVKG